MRPEIFVSLSVEDVARLVEALDSHEYWELGDALPRNNGHVFIPGDLQAGADRYWDGVELTHEVIRVIEEVAAGRSLSERLRRSADGALA